MTDPERRWPPQVYGVGSEPDARITLANERTFLAWIRTALGFLAAGVAVVAFARFGAAGLRPEIRIAALLLIISGLACAVSAYVRWFRVERAIRLGQALPASVVAPIVTAVLVLVAIAAVILVGVV